MAGLAVGEVGKRGRSMNEVRGSVDGRGARTVCGRSGWVRWGRCGSWVGVGFMAIFSCGRATHNLVDGWENCGGGRSEDGWRGCGRSRSRGMG